MNEEPMNGDVAQLLALLKKILRTHSHGAEHIAQFLEQKSFHLNLCFLTFVPMTPEELMEFEEMYEDYVNRAEEAGGRAERPKLEFKLNAADQEFLKQNGINF